ncbi:polyadenylate-binding protein RBP47-like isoform X1 [Trifolium pratense]|uniref:polyadenylate-binding protein RBP47-like isoform X1 n=1 Tax=Trifolium pratense TaxID=57577 RepID=UPI001E697B59|nr:polyadenylate-binding protein RBP47-like isoform X1 [Trifolium pratense]
MAQQTNGGDLNQNNSNNNNNQNQTPQQQQQHQQHQQQWAAAQPHQYQQQWMSMQYPATAMAMMQQQMMMYPQHYMPYVHPHHYQQPPHQQQVSPPPNQSHHNHNHHHQQQQHQYQQKQVSPEEIRTIWLGDLHHWMDETFLHNCFAHTGEVVSAKVIRNKQTGQSEGYGFVEFYSRAMAEKVLQNFNGTMMPNTDQAFRLNWATFSAAGGGGGGERRSSEATSDLSVFVGDLAIDVTDAMLQEVFASRFSSIKGAKVVIDSNTGRSKGYGFVRFGDENERTRAMTEMNGVYCSSRPMRVGVATPKKTYGNPQQYSSQAVVLAGGGGHSSNGAVAQGSQSDGDSNNTTIFVGGLDSEISDEDLRQPFLQFGDVISVKIPVGKGCGFVQLADRKNAEDAIQALNGTVIGKQTVRLSWGRSPGNKHWRNDSNGHYGGGYGGHGYGGGHGYAARQNQDIAMQPAAAVQGAS